MSKRNITEVMRIIWKKLSQSTRRSISLVRSKVASFLNAPRSSNTPLFKWQMNTKNDKRMWFVHKLFEQSS